MDKVLDKMCGNIWGSDLRQGKGAVFILRIVGEIGRRALPKRWREGGVVAATRSCNSLRGANAESVASALTRRCSLAYICGRGRECGTTC